MTQLTTQPQDMDVAALRHEHHFNTDNQAAERSTRVVMWITAAMMIVEIGAGWWFNSMALLADGWHMSSHAVAIGVSAFAYTNARRLANDRRFAFGTWKIEILGGFASAVFLLVIAGLMLFASFERLFTPQPIHYKEAIVIAVLGLIVNTVCAFILGGAHDHRHSHDHHDHHHSHAAHSHADHGHDHQHGEHEDLNLKAAYVHVIADAATSVLAIIALIGGWLWGWSWLDPLMGIVGAVLVAVWAKGLIQQTAKVLLDREMDAPVVEEIREVIAELPPEGHTIITDLHVWRVGRDVYSCAMSLLTQDAALTPEAVKARLAIHEEIVHTTIEIHRLGA